jgi:hypothetical protein
MLVYMEATTATVKFFGLQGFAAVVGTQVVTRKFRTLDEAVEATEALGFDVELGENALGVAGETFEARC